VAAGGAAEVLPQLPRATVTPYYNYQSFLTFLWTREGDK